ncbi:MAG: bifunctional NADP-dependent methylenetetrahydromethanopterin dehydrogenase/methylenetetrahydrofolate dehydrogenase [Planctomycetota bacterium]|nr:MAG: bifunctional NADP-dependent methylenetetrahydromethanopterin dehydrogenase/methylenetetrahydrofolate dehydrogenase [Planctomycetota bacterium]
MPARILLQFDTDPQPSSFDAVVAVDAGAEVLLRHGGVTAANVVPLVHGAMFTRGGVDLHATAIFVGGSDVAAAEEVFAKIQETFFGPVRVCTLLDPSGANTTAAAAVVAAARHLALDAAGSELRAVVLGGTGPVGQRVARLLAGKGVAVTVVSRCLERAEATCRRITARLPAARLTSLESSDPAAQAGALPRALADAQLVVACGAAGATLLDAQGRSCARGAGVLIDLNAVPPAGIVGIAAQDKARPDGHAVVYGALGVGGTKMKIHREAIRRLFVAPAAVLDAEELLAIGESLERAAGR